MAVGLAHGDRGKDGSIGFLVGVSGDIVDSFRVIALGNDPGAVSLVLNLELHAVIELSFGGGFRIHIGEQLGQVQAEGKHMTIVNEGVVVVAGGALPGQNDGVFVALFAVGKGLVRVNNGAVGHTGGVVGVSGVQLRPHRR